MTGSLVGVITDGDLRRLLEENGEDRQWVASGVGVDDARAPVCVRADALATEALRIMEERRITSLPCGGR